MDTAADVERIRQALSPNDGLVAYGASHGSQYGRAYLELYGEHVKALVLDGVVDHSIGLPTFITRNTLVCSAAYCVPTGGRSGTTPLLPLPRKPSASGASLRLALLGRYANRTRHGRGRRLRWVAF